VRRVSTLKTLEVKSCQEKEEEKREGAKESVGKGRRD
jgi:hypothetical protein